MLNALRYVKSAEATTRLSDLGLKPEWLTGAVKRGVRPVLNCTTNDPPQLPGLIGWGKITRELRDLLGPVAGFKPVSIAGQASTVHPSGRLAIVVASGDERTGLDSEQHPATRSKKGTATKAAIAENQLTFAACSADFAQFQEPTVDNLNAKQTWLLLYFIDEDDSEVRVELSLPESRDADGYVTAWRERILLPAISLDGTTTVDDIADGDFTDEEVITVNLKAG